MAQKNIFGKKITKSTPKVKPKKRVISNKRAIEKSVDEDEMFVIKRIEKLRRNMLIHSFAYYELNRNFISDFEFDERARELVKLQETYPNLSKLGEYYNDFKDFDGSTGYDLPFRIPWVQGTVEGLIRYEERMKRDGTPEKANEILQQTARRKTSKKTKRIRSV